MPNVEVKYFHIFIDSQEVFHDSYNAVDDDGWTVRFVDVKKQIHWIC